jgi:hypothetical protein
MNQILTEAEAHWEQITASTIAAYSFVIAHGGLIPMWNKFIGKTPSTTTVMSGATTTQTAPVAAPEPPKPPTT